MELTIGQALQQGVTAHKEGKLQEAERFYLAILKVQPKHPDANHNLGLIAVSMNQFGLALQFFKSAVEVNPDIEQFWLSYIEALITEGQFESAKQVIKEGEGKGVSKEKLKAFAQKLVSVKVENNLTQAPSQAEVVKLINHYQNRQYGDAETLAISITQQFPEHQFSWKVMGALLERTGRKPEALNANQRAVQLVPQDAEAHYNLGNTFKALGRLDEAEASYTQAIAFKPDFAEAHSNLGVTLRELGRLDEAEVSYTQAIVLKPAYDEAYSNLGNTLKELRRLDEAKTSYTQAIVLKPDKKTATENIVKLPVGQLDLKILDLCDKALLVQSESVKNSASDYFFQANLLKHKGLVEQSFGEFCKANKLRWEEVREQFAAHHRTYTGHLDRIKQWTPNIPELAESRLTKLFLMGPSRSGKSSLEHVLSRTSQVKPLYEGVSNNRLSGAFVNGKDPCETLFDTLFFQTEDEILGQGYEVITSTSPDTIFYSDYLVDMLPNAYFLLIRRDLQDLASEIFTNEYTKGHFYSYDPNGISTHLCVHYQICKALAFKIPDRCITLSFQDIINSPEDTIKKIGDLVCRKFEVGRLHKYGTSFPSKSLFRDHFAGINNSFKF
ncbi:tetratricopeptide repeat protein [Alphaproteobacteria bacterium]|nr:tetratricopeptide repeat protein [Alphaproteobacteria bacterium]